MRLAKEEKMGDCQNKINNKTYNENHSLHDNRPVPKGVRGGGGSEEPSRAATRSAQPNEFFFFFF